MWSFIFKKGRRPLFGIIVTGIVPCELLKIKFNNLSILPDT